MRGGAKLAPCRIGRAIQTALRQPGSRDAYIAHLLSVAALVIEDGGSGDEAIAALLHDAAEDQGGEVM